MKPSTAPLIAVFGHDAAESTLRKRIASFQNHGWRVAGFTFARPKSAAAPDPFWHDTHLGRTRDRNYARRLPALAAAVPRILRRAETLRAARALYARNIDMLALAALAKRLTGSRARLVYEVLDVQRPFAREDALGAALRAAERRLLSGTDLLVVSAPDFLTRYFAPVQGYAGPWRLLENKLAAHQVSAAPDAFARETTHPPLDGPITIGWFGVLRCMRSLDALETVAARLGPRVRIVLRGRLSEEDLPPARLEAALRRTPNLVFEGPYASPDDLRRVYGAIHFAWALDYTDAGANSDWLLPNRLYEGSYFGVPALARAGTAAGRRVEEHGLGHALSEPVEDAVCALIERVDAGAYARMRAAILAQPPGAFVDETDTATLLDALAAAEPAGTGTRR